MQSFVLISMPRGPSNMPPSGYDLAVLDYHLKRLVHKMCTQLYRGGGGGGYRICPGGTQSQRGAAPALRISRKKGSFLRPLHVRDFVTEGYFFVPRYEVWGIKIPLQSTKYTRLLRRVTPEVTGLPSLLTPLAAAKPAEDYKI